MYVEGYVTSECENKRPKLRRGEKGREGLMSAADDREKGGRMLVVVVLCQIWGYEASRKEQAQR